MDRGTDRHKVKRAYQSGSEKRKLAREKNIKNEAVIAKSRRITDFTTSKSSASSVSVHDSEQNVSYSNLMNYWAFVYF